MQAAGRASRALQNVVSIQPGSALRWRKHVLRNIGELLPDYMAYSLPVFCCKIVFVVLLLILFLPLFQLLLYFCVHFPIILIFFHPSRFFFLSESA
jgi:hypothetical protein